MSSALVEASAVHELNGRLRGNGFSMLPSIWPGDIACVSRVDQDAYRPGDVVLFSRNGRLFVHRLVEMSCGAVVTRGDSMLDADPPVAVSDVLGRVAGGDGRACERGAEGPLGQSGRLVRMVAYVSSCVS